MFLLISKYFRHRHLVIFSFVYSSFLSYCYNIIYIYTLYFSLSISVTLAHISITFAIYLTAMFLCTLLYISAYIVSISLTDLFFTFAYVLCNSFVNCTNAMI